MELDQCPSLTQHDVIYEKGSQGVQTKALKRPQNTDQPDQEEVGDLIKVSTYQNIFSSPLAFIPPTMRHRPSNLRG